MIWLSDDRAGNSRTHLACPEPAREILAEAGASGQLGAGLDEGASTRLLVHAGKLIVSGVPPLDACSSAVSQALTDDREMIAAINELSASVF